ncbi:hypothetical protein GcM3_145021, partial [Golovinomyces cichoracearum]
TLNTLRQLFVECDEETKPEDYQIAPNAFDNFLIGVEVPLPQMNTACDNITHCKREKSLYAHFSLVIFLAGKLIDETNRTAITVARPKALVEKYKIPVSE